MIYENGGFMMKKNSPEKIDLKISDHKTNKRSKKSFMASTARLACFLSLLVFPDTVGLLKANVVATDRNNKISAGSKEELLNKAPVDLQLVRKSAKKIKFEKNWMTKFVSSDDPAKAEIARYINAKKIAAEKKVAEKIDNVIAQISKLQKFTRYSRPVPAADKENKYFFVSYDPEKRIQGLFLTEEIGYAQTVSKDSKLLLDSPTLDKSYGLRGTITNIFPSPSGNRVGILINKRGADFSDIYILDLSNDKRVLLTEDRIRFCSTNKTNLLWIDDEQFVYNANYVPSESESDSFSKKNQLLLHKVGTEQRNDKVLLANGALHNFPVELDKKNGRIFLIISKRLSSEALFYLEVPAVRSLLGTNADGKKQISEEAEATGTDTTTLYKVIGYSGKLLSIPKKKKSLTLSYEKSTGTKKFSANLSTNKIRFVGLRENSILVIVDGSNGASLLKIDLPTNKNDSKLQKNLISSSEKNRRIKDAVLIRNAQKTNSDLIAVSTSNGIYDEVELLELSGRRVGKIDLPTNGTVLSLSATQYDDNNFLFIEFAAYIYPRTTLVYDFANRELRNCWPMNKNINFSELQAKEIIFNSFDGTKVPMTIVGKRSTFDSIATGKKAPTLLYGYGGLGVSLTSNSLPSAIYFWILSGGLYAVANIRGGGEFGEEWHNAGMKMRKKNVFRDFKYAAKYLIKNGFTSPDKLAIQGTCNGGLLVLYVFLKNPELFRTVIAQVPLSNMLKFHKFGEGDRYISEFGSPEDAEEGNFLREISPYHLIKERKIFSEERWHNLGRNCSAENSEQKEKNILITAYENDEHITPFHAIQFSAKVDEEIAHLQDFVNFDLLPVPELGHYGKGNRRWQLFEQAYIITYLTNLLMDHQEENSAIRFERSTKRINA
jgi:prolyl oligopeptidase PreP (S9A serine peptidase family)